MKTPEEILRSLVEDCTLLGYYIENELLEIRQRRLEYITVDILRWQIHQFISYLLKINLSYEAYQQLEYQLMVKLIKYLNVDLGWNVYCVSSHEVTDYLKYIVDRPKRDKSEGTKAFIRNFIAEFFVGFEKDYYGDETNIERYYLRSWVPGINRTEFMNFIQKYFKDKHQAGFEELDALAAELEYAVYQSGLARIVLERQIKDIPDYDCNSYEGFINESGAYSVISDPPNRDIGFTYSEVDIVKFLIGYFAKQNAVKQNIDSEAIHNSIKENWMIFEGTYSLVLEKYLLKKKLMKRILKTVRYYFE
jgi:hypothetical protein